MDRMVLMKIMFSWMIIIMWIIYVGGLTVMKDWMLVIYLFIITPLYVMVTLLFVTFWKDCGTSTKVDCWVKG